MRELYGTVRKTVNPWADPIIASQAMGLNTEPTPRVRSPIGMLDASSISRRRSPGLAALAGIAGLALAGCATTQPQPDSRGALDAKVRCAGGESAACRGGQAGPGLYDPWNAYGYRDPWSSYADPWSRRSDPWNRHGDPWSRYGDPWARYGDPWSRDRRPVWNTDPRWGAGLWYDPRIGGGRPVDPRRHRPPPVNAAPGGPPPEAMRPPAAAPAPAPDFDAGRPPVSAPPPEMRPPPEAPPYRDRPGVGPLTAEP